MDQLDQTLRRAFLFMPLVFSGLLTIWYRPAPTGLRYCINSAALKFTPEKP